MKHPSSLPFLVFADHNGNITDFPDLSMLGKSNDQYRVPKLTELIPLPEGSELFLLPDRLPVGSDLTTKEPLLLEDNPYQPGKRVQAVAAFMAPAHTAILGCAYHTASENAALLPLFAYSAVGWYDGKFLGNWFQKRQ